MNTTILIESRNVYGRTNIYIVSDHAPLVRQLTGKSTIDNNDIAALIKLGFEVKEPAKATVNYQLTN